MPPFPAAAPEPPHVPVEDSSPARAGFTTDDSSYAGAGRALGRTLVARWRRGSTAAASQAVGPRPLSPAEAGIWMFEQLNPGTAVYAVSFAAWCRGPLDAERLAVAVEALTERHEALRSTFEPDANGTPKRIVRPRLPADLAWQDAPDGGGTEAARRAAERAAAEPFDLIRGPLTRVRVFRIGPEEHLILLCAHHLVCDGGSLPVLLGDLSAAYAGEHLPPAVHPATRPDPEAGDDGLAYWRKRLAGLPGLDLPADHPRSARRGFAAHSVPLRISAPVVAAADRIAADEGATRFAVVLAAHQLALSMLSGKRDFGVGVPFAGRGGPGQRHAVGLLVNPLVLRADLSGGPSFRELVRRARRSLLEAVAHGDTPFEELAAALAPGAGTAGTPLFEVNLAYHGEEPAGVQLGEAVLEPVALCRAALRHDVETHLWRHGEELRGHCDVSADAFTAETAARIADYLVSVLAAALAESDRPVDTLHLLIPADERVLEHWSASPATPTPNAHTSQDTALNHLVERRAAERPDAPAVERDGMALTYGELERRANRLAHWLRARGIGPEDVVGVRMPRTPDLVVALLGVLKAGAAYLPLDPAYPAERLAFMRQDSGAALVLAALDEAGLAEQPDTPVAPAGRDAAQLAYIIYTSGSTGRPKGVMMTHVNAIALAEWAKAAYTPAELSRVLATTSVCFDLSVFELFGTLAAGGTVVLVDDALALLNGSAPDATLVNTVPSAARELVAADALPPSATVVNLAGEPVPAALVERLYATGGIRAVHNLYGPSEDTTYSTGALVGPDEPVPPIGHPLPGERALVLDEALRPVPVGAVGELYLGGPGLARGYRARPGLTAARFLPDPSGKHPGERVYRTGDLVRYRPDGQLEYRGRRDDQLKVRGFRVEPGEIEALLRSDPEVLDAAVAVWDGLLTAYVTGPTPEAAARLVPRARAALPAHLVPHRIEVLEAIPLTPNGKVDRKALPAPRAAGPAGGKPPRAGIETLVAEVWQEVLGVSSTTREDEFFAAGGHSLLAGRLCARLSARLGTPVPVRLVFERPVLADLAAALPAPGGSEAPAPAVTRLDRVPDADGVHRLPASAGQRRMWFLARLNAVAASGYVTQGAIRLHGTLDAELLQVALDVVTARHETLRTTFTEVEGELLQVVHPHRTVRIEQTRIGDGEDGSHGDGGAGDSGNAELFRLAAEAAAALDLERGPLLRVHLARLGPDLHVLLLSTHHIICDGWSLANLGAELSAAYTALRDGQSPELPELTAQYADFAAWQDQIAAENTAARAYWRDELAGLPSLDLACDRPRPPHSERRGDRVPMVFGPETAAALEAVARTRGATPGMALMAAWQLLLGRYCGQRDFGVGTVTAGRSRAELEPVIGFLANTLLLRADLTGRPGFDELVDRVRRSTLSALAHQDLPFDHAVRAANLPRGADAPPPYRASFVFQNTPPARLELPGVRSEAVDLPATGAVSDLGLTLWPDGAGLHGFLHYDRELFDRATVERLASSLGILLHAALESPQADVFELPVDLPARLEPATPAEFPHMAVARWARTRPEAAAAVWAGGRLSYAELDERSDRLAHWLRAHGIDRENVVGVDVPRTGELLVTVLAVWKAGGAFLALDGRIPRERRAFMLADSGAVFTVTAEVLDRAGREADVAPAGPPEAALGPRSLSHVAYTSGSTGVPKGVMAEHGQLLAYLGWATPYFMDGGRGAPLPSPIAFDLSFAALLAPLMSGDTVFLLPDEDPPVDALPAALAEGGFSFVKLTPAHLALLDDVLPGPALVASTRRLVVAGEALTYGHLAAWARHAPDTLVVNEYGPTETVVGCVKHEFTASAGRDGLGDGPVPIGRGVPGTRLMVLDDMLCPVVPGGMGELYIGGAQVTRGYLGRAGLTARQFLPDPGVPGGRMYRTGDLVRELPNGALLFLGRRDHQVKLRGYRVELGEVEGVLTAHPAVAQAVAVVRGTGAERMLVAYTVTVAGRPAPSEEELRAHARAHLPAPMVPARCVTLPDLPLTSTGKLDRAALPAPAEAAATTPVATARPAAPGGTADDVAALWRALLQRDEVAPQDDFFALGGHSLLATRLVARLRDAGRPQATLRMVFEHPVLADFAAALDRRSGAETAFEDRPALPVAPREPGLEGARTAPASYGQRRLWLLSRLDADSARAYVIQGAVRLTGQLDAELLDEALRTVVRRHEVLRTTFQECGGGLRQVIRAVGRVRLETVDLADESGLRALAHDAASGFDLERGPLLRLHLVRGPGDRLTLLATVHHIIADGWSLAVLGSELGRCYEALRRGEQPQLPLPPLQYADYAHGQAAALDGEKTAEQLRRIGDRLAQLPPLELRTDRPRPPKPSYRGSVVRRHVPAAAGGALRELAVRRAASPSMVVLAVFLVLLRRYGNQPDLAVGVPVAGRSRPELEELIGFFVDTVVVRAKVHDERPFDALVDGVRDASLAAYGDQEVPFDKVLEALHPERDLSRTPLFTVMFNHLSQPAAELPVAGLRAEPVEMPWRTAKYDMELYVRDAPDGGFDLALCTSDDLFETSTVEALADQLLDLAGQAAADPSSPVAELSLGLPVTEDVQVAEHAAAADTGGETIGSRFTAQVRRTPDRTALWTATGSLDYAGTDRRARRLAAALIAVAGPDARRVGVLCEQGLDVPIALLGVLAAGRSYVPLDPVAPRARLAEQLAAASVDALVSCSVHRGLAEELAAGRPVIDVAGTEGVELSEWAPADPSDPAYVLFTSGSTGSPKAVLQSHRNVLHHVDAYAAAVGVEPGDRLTALSAYTFDAAVLDLYGALLHGATACPLDVRRDGVAAVRSALADAGVTLYHSTPTVFRLLARADGDAPWPAGLRTVTLGGESLLGSDLKLARDRLPGRRVINLYGSTECTIALLHTVEPGTSEHRGRVPIGRPVPGTSVRLVDGDGRPAELYGEIVCVGPHIALGYLDPDQTAAAFAPLDDVPAYRTGDFAWRLPDGSFEFAGRRDGQAKLHGHRVETGEIEFRLRESPDVDDATVTLRRDPDGELRLTAYVSGGAQPTTIRDHLYTVLPHYMVPAVIVPLPELPTTRTGKVDRSRLPEPDWRDTAVSADPQTATEQVVAEVFGAVLGHRVGRHDNFFHLGGQSLQAGQVAARLSGRLALQVPLRTLFERPTVAALAESLDAAAAVPKNGHQPRTAHNTPIRPSARRRQKEATQ